MKNPNLCRCGRKKIRYYVPTCFYCHKPEVTKIEMMDLYPAIYHVHEREKALGQCFDVEAFIDIVSRDCDFRNGSSIHLDAFDGDLLDEEEKYYSEDEKAMIVTFLKYFPKSYWYLWNISW
jgi:hypothetical protein